MIDMAKIQVTDKKGKKTEVMEVSTSLVEAKVNPDVMFEAVKAHLANRRAGTAATKTRSEVAGGAAKPWRQKGTGRARAGSIRAPQFTGGGAVFGPSPRSFTVRLNKKVKKLAFASAISDKFAGGSLFVLNNLKLKENKTREAQAVLDNLKVEGKVTLVLSDLETDTAMAFRNLPNVSVWKVDNVATYDIVSSDSLIISVETFKQLQEVRG